jgi:trehalose 6-phosphate phosphatase
MDVRMSPAFALFLDFDGTLVDIVDRPDAVAVEAGLPEALAALSRRLGGALAIVSGRPIAFLDRHLGEGVFDAAGLHGIERRLGGRFQGCRPEDHPRLRAGIRDLKVRFLPDPRIIIEDKGCTVAVHWRLAPDRAEEAQGAAETLAAHLGPDYRVQQGKAVAEILPAASGKGRVIASFLTEPPYRGRRPIFIGDDLTDEHGFETVNTYGGLSVRVGPGSSVAAVRLASPAALRTTLRAWADGEPIGFDVPQAG